MRIAILGALILVGFVARAAYDQSSMAVLDGRFFNQSITPAEHHPS